MAITGAAGMIGYSLIPMVNIIYTILTQFYFKNILFPQKEYLSLLNDFIW